MIDRVRSSDLEGDIWSVDEVIESICCMLRCMSPQVAHRDQCSDLASAFRALRKQIDGHSWPTTTRLTLTGLADHSAFAPANLDPAMRAIHNRQRGDVQRGDEVGALGPF